MEKLDDEELLKEIGRKIKVAREARNPRMSQAELARCVGVTQQTIAAIERGQRTNFLPKIERILELPAGHLLYGQQESTLGISQPMVSACPILKWEDAVEWPNNKSRVIKDKSFESFSTKLILSADSYILQLADHQYENTSEPNAPFFRKGSYIVIDPAKKYKKEDFVIAKRRTSSNLILRRYIKHDDGQEFLKVITEGHREPLMDFSPDIIICGVVVAHLDILA